MMVLIGHGSYVQRELVVNVLQPENFTGKEYSERSSRGYGAD